MTAEELKKRIHCALDETEELQLILVLKHKDKVSEASVPTHGVGRIVPKKNDPYILRLADVQNEDLLVLLKQFENFLDTTILNNDNLSIRSLSTDDEVPNAIYTYDYPSCSDEINVLKDFSLNKPITVEKFNFDTDHLEDLSGYIIRIGSMDHGFALFKIHYSFSLIKRKNILLYECMERFRYLQSDDVIRLTPDAQLMRIGDTIYVLDLSVLGKRLGVSDAIRKAAEESAKTIDKLEILDNVGVLEEMAAEHTFARRLAKISQGSPIFALENIQETIVSFSMTNPALSGKFKYNKDKTKIRLDTKKSKDLFLKLLDDSILQSELTKMYYEVNSKDKLNTQ